MHDASTTTISLKDISEDLVADYLRADKTFFERHDDVLAELSIPHQTGTAISLIERQVNSLREKNQQLQQEMRETLQIAKDNEHLFEVTKGLTLGLVSADSLQEIITVVHETLLHDFKAEFIRIGLTQLPEVLASYPGAP